MIEPGKPEEWAEVMRIVETVCPSAVQVTDGAGGFRVQLWDVKAGVGGLAAEGIQTEEKADVIAWRWLQARRSA